VRALPAHPVPRSSSSLPDTLFAPSDTRARLHRSKSARDRAAGAVRALDRI